MTHCKFCNKKIEKNSDFILEGKYPGLGARYSDWFLGKTFYGGLDNYGDCYHKSCYNKIKKND